MNFTAWSACVLLTVIVACLRSGESIGSVCKTTCHNGGTLDQHSNYCHCPPDYYGYYCDFKRGSRCQGENAKDCQTFDFHYCFETDTKFDGFDCDYCPLGTNTDCSITDPRFVEACNRPENRCQGGAVCRAHLSINDQIFTKCNCTAPRGGSRCQFENPCRDNPCGINQECRPVPTDIDNGRQCYPCNILYRIRNLY